ncbi:MAG: peroxidase family protein, partial [Pseudomonadota bacterium]
WEEFMKHIIPVSALCVITLAACDNGGDDFINAAPVISTGDAQAVIEGSTVQLSGTASDPNGDEYSVARTQESGPEIELIDSTSLDASFQAPNVNESVDIVLRLTVTDSRGSATSQTMTISIADTNRDGPSSQGIPNDGESRRNRARNKRNRDRRRIADREVRTFDGSNNNLDNPDWGATFEHLQRLAPADYADGISDLAGPDRPSARAVSNGVADQVEGLSLPNTVNGTDFVWQWGQFIDHDLDLTDGAEESADILVPAGDPFFDPTDTGAQVITFNRALFDGTTGTDVNNPREQENEITSWIDGSMIYGSDEERNAALRETGTPYLATSAGNLLPFNTNSLANANGFVSDPTRLFLAGDVRANEQLGLTVLHTLFVREHNRLAQRIMDNNPNAEVDDVFEQARRLVIAKIQVITYEEWLPALIGENAIADYSGYDDSINPTIFNAFSVAAFRLGHSMLNEQILRLDAAGNEIAAGHLDLKEAFFTAPTVLQAETDLDPILRGFATQLHQEIDPLVIDDIRNFLFGQPGSGGFDLASLNIQRGRDHGVPGYNDMRAALGLTRVTQFGEITSDNDLAEALFDTYGDVNEIDLWVGGLAEDAVAGSQLGELFQTILVRQFTALRDGDRFWWEQDLTASEQDRVRNTTLAEIIRDNTDIGTEIRNNVFIAP